MKSYDHVVTLPEALLFRTLASGRTDTRKIRNGSDRVASDST